MTPKEDPAAKAERERQRKAAEAQATDQAQSTASGLSKDLRSTYGLRALSMFGMGTK